MRSITGRFPACTSYFHRLVQAWPQKQFTDCVCDNRQSPCRSDQRQKSYTERGEGRPAKQEERLRCMWPATPCLRKLGLRLTLLWWEHPALHTLCLALVSPPLGNGRTSSQMPSHTWRINVVLCCWWVVLCLKKKMERGLRDGSMGRSDCFESKAIPKSKSLAVL